MTSDETTQQNNFTDDEKALAEHFKVKPEIVRIFSKLKALNLNEPAEDLSMFSDLMQDKKEQEAETQPEQEQPTEEKGPGATVEDMVEQWLMNQSYKAKLAIAIYWEYLTGDHGTGDLIQRVTAENTAEVIRMATNPDNSLSKEDTIMTGIACELFVWSKNL